MLCSPNNDKAGVFADGNDIYAEDGDDAIYSLDNTDDAAVLSENDTDAAAADCEEHDVACSQ